MQATIMSKHEHDFVRDSMPDDKISLSLAEFFAVFSDPTRLKIISALSVSDMCVNDLTALLDVNQSTVSHQLRLMRDAGIVDCSRDGKVVYYSVVNPFVNDIMLTGIDNLDLKEGRYDPLA